MKSLKKLIKKVFYGEAKKYCDFCIKEGKIYTVRKFETDNCDFMVVSENFETNELLRYVVACNDCYYSLIYMEDFISGREAVETVKIKEFFESLGYEEIIYEKFLVKLQEEHSYIELRLLEDNDDF